MAVVLEGGYDLNALEVSSEAVIKTLMINPNDTAAFNSLLCEVSGKEDISYASMQAHAHANIRESWKNMSSNVAKAHKKSWPCLSHLVCEKMKRRNSGVSQNSDSSNSSMNTGGQITPRDFAKARTQSMGGELQSHQSPMGKEEQERNRADSLAFTFGVSNPIPEIVKKE